AAAYVHIRLTHSGIGRPGGTTTNAYRDATFLLLAPTRERAPAVTDVAFFARPRDTDPDPGVGAVMSGILLFPFTTETSSFPPTAPTYCSRTSIVTFRDCSIAATRGWETPIRRARSRCE